MHRHSGGHRRDPFFAEIQYRGQRPSICESEKRDVSGCLRKVLRLPRSVFPRSSCPKLTPHISTVFVHDGTISSKKLSWHILSWHASCVGAAECAAPRRHPWRRAPTRSRAQLRRRLSQGALMDETRDPADEGETGGRWGRNRAICLTSDPVSRAVRRRRRALVGALAEIALGNRVAALLPSSAEIY